ncbi:exopolyphosphatase [Microbacterium sorbitolivorans]|uniref:FAD/NAD(P)-binding protein n=1 Tax=Microbacterium sorbitolivorans TaxID=1867410 RepID=UPI0013B05D21|nr:FAD/NAD(P)-binding protein [Microbacterium sorbitolivorans]GGF33039.1 exopolyphosphatase [Microbacterium sorbitolivorans]
MTSRTDIAIVGGGPRGVLLVERILANLAPGTPLGILLIDDVEVGAGRVWRTDQTREMCMNTLAGAVTLFTDDSVDMAGPVLPGPNLHEWSLGALDGSLAVRPGLVGDYRDELAAQRPESHPSRALFGEYIRWCLDRAIAGAPRGVRIREKLGRVVRVDGDALLFADGSEIAARAIALAPGWLAPAGEPFFDADGDEAVHHDRRVAGSLPVSGPIWILPGSPIEQRLDLVPAGADVIVRGLGMGFFDAMALLMIGRGGRFEGGRYVPSGREPRLLVTSPRGLPYRAKSLYGSLPPRAPQRHLRGTSWDTRDVIDVDREMWPLIRKDAYEAYYVALERVRPGSVELPAALDAVEASDGSLAGLAAAVAPHSADVLDLEALIRPAVDVDDVDGSIARFVAHDLAEAEKGTSSPEKAALWSLSQARGVAHRAGSFGRFDQESSVLGYGELKSVGGSAGSGPPAFRNRQLLALHDAGLVRFLGPGTVSVTGGVFRVRSTLTNDTVASAKVLIDALVRPHDARNSADPLMRSLADEGRIRPFALRSRNGSAVATRGIDVDPATHRVVHADGSLDASLHVAGIPLDETMHDALISPMPGANATMLRECDRIARSLLRVSGR